jgi:DNA-binding Xre family transcriptional regulator
VTGVIVNHVSRAMGERRLSIKEVARRSSLAYSTVHDAYHDKALRMDWKTVDALCRGIGVASLTELYEYRADQDDAS